MHLYKSRNIKLNSSKEKFNICSPKRLTTSIQNLSYATLLLICLGRLATYSLVKKYLPKDVAIFFITIKYISIFIQYEHIAL